MKVEVFADADSVAEEAAALIAAEARAAVAERGNFVMAVSGGRTPWLMLRALAREDVPWEGVHVVQVDERVAPLGDTDRNLTHWRKPARVVEPRAHSRCRGRSDSAAKRYAATLQELSGSPPVLDHCSTGLGPDGHTASLVPGDPGFASD
jgi:6-phosphogluconolactonase